MSVTHLCSTSTIAPVLRDAPLLLIYVLTVCMSLPCPPVSASKMGASCHGCRRPGVLVLVNDVDWELRCSRLPCAMASVESAGYC